MKRAYEVGQVVQLSLSIIDASGLPRDPASLKLEVVSPSGAASSVTWPNDAGVVRDALGQFHALLPITEWGDEPYRYRFTALGGVVPDVFEDYVPVRKPLF